MVFSGPAVSDRAWLQELGQVEAGSVSAGWSKVVLGFKSRDPWGSAGLPCGFVGNVDRGVAIVDWARHVARGEQRVAVFRDFAGLEQLT